MDGVLLVNKEPEMTSQVVVSKIKRILNVKKAGHAGTLDPNAVGLLVVLLGKATKCSPFLMNKEKVYRTRMVLGKSTDTYDIWGQITEERKAQNHSLTEINAVLKSFIGQSRQLPPIYSAIKVQGKKLLEYARKNQEVEIKERDIYISDIILNSYEDDILDLTINCDAGTYIRSLVVDIGKKLGELATMTALNRLSSGNFTLENAYTLKEIQECNYRLLTNEEALADFPSYETADHQAIINGKPLDIESDENELMIYCQKKLYACYKKGEDGRYYSKRGLF